MAARRDTFEAQHLRNLAKYEKQISVLYAQACREAGVSSTTLRELVLAAGPGANFAKIPAVRRVLDKLERKLAKRLETTVVDGIKAEWGLANAKYDALIGTMVAGDLMEQMDEKERQKMMAQNLSARDAFIARKEGGLNLSQRVWNYSGQMREAMEEALELGIWEGRSAAEIARDLKQYLVYPDKLFRRVRDAETGELKISEPASLFHPGQGVYRSSYQNALRLARTETNMAYRKSDTVRRQGLYFVVGIEVHLSNNHNCKGVPEGEFVDICDELQGKYPPYFDFTGWHPNCRCWTSTIMQTDEEFFRDSDGKYRGSVNEVKDVPPAFKDWIERNRDRIDNAASKGRLAYFLRDNRWTWDEKAERPEKETAPTAAIRSEERHAKRTEKQVEAIKARWAERSRAIKNRDNVLRLVKSIPGMDKYLRNQCPLAYGTILGEKKVTEENYYQRLNGSAKLVINEMGDLKRDLSVLDKPLDVLRKWGIDTANEIKRNVERTMLRYKSESWVEKADHYRFEARWIEENRKDSIPTWREAQAAYLKAARKADYMATWGDLKERFEELAKRSTDEALVAQLRSSIGKNVSAFEDGLKQLEEEIELVELQQKYDMLIADVPARALPQEFKAAVEDAIAKRDIKAAKMAVKTVEIGVNAWNDAADRLRSFLPNIKDADLRDEADRALNDGTIAEVTTVADKAENYVKFVRLVEVANDLLKDYRNIIEKLAPMVLKVLEAAMENPDMDAGTLNASISSAKRVLDDWDNLSGQLKDYEGYSTSKQYVELLEEARKAAREYDEMGLIDALDKLKEKKEQLEKVRAYDAAIAEEWKKMNEFVAKVKAKNPTDPMLLAAISSYEATANGDHKIKDARVDYQTIRDRALQLGLSDDTVTLQDLQARLGKDMPKTLLNLADHIKNREDVYRKRGGGVASREDEVIRRMKEIFAANVPGMNMPYFSSSGKEVVNSVFASYIKGQLETGTGQGAVNRNTRTRATQNLFGADTSKMKNEEFEKYGFLMSKDILEQANSGIASQYWRYGDGIQIRFKPEKVIATFTMQDSLGSGLVPSLITDPRITSFDQYQTDILSGKLHTDAIKATQNYACCYIELQYHGMLTLDCIDSVFTYYENFQNIKPETLKTMASLGITLYTSIEGSLCTYNFTQNRFEADIAGKRSYYDDAARKFVEVA